MQQAAGDSLERQIKQVEPQEDGTALVTYDCGHSAIWVIPPSPQQTTVLGCAECINELIRQHKEQRPQ